MVEQNVEFEITLNLHDDCRQLLRDRVRGDVAAQDVALHHHLLLPRHDVRQRVLDQLPRAARERPRPHDHPRHRLPLPRQHLQQHHQQDPQS